MSTSITSFDQANEIAATFNAVLATPDFETAPDAVKNNIHEMIAATEARLDAIGAQDPEKVTFASTVQALAYAGEAANLGIGRMWLMKETLTDAAMRDACTEAIKVLNEWQVELDYREDLYRILKAFEATKPTLEGEEAKLLAECLRDYRRIGFDLPEAERKEVEALRKEIAALGTDFDTNITQASAPITFSRAELEGVPDNFLDHPGIKTGDDEYTVEANITWHAIMVISHATQEATRKTFYFARNRLAAETNRPVLNSLVRLRAELAGKLGYDTWGDYQTETRMAGKAGRVVEFLEKMRDGLRPKLEDELEVLRALKAEETGDEAAEIRMWDYGYYLDRLKKTRYQVDTEALRVYFPYQQVLDGMFAIYQEIFGLTFHAVEPPSKWVDDLQFYIVTDTETGEPMGCFYLDMFPREGKFNHFAQFPTISGARLEDGRYQRPTIALICNFQPPSPDKPSLLSHDDVETLFHEFGHAMHSILTRAEYARFSGTSVPRDFVEAPSQMLEYWIWDKGVLDRFASHFENPEEKIPGDIIERLDAARKATNGLMYSRQISLGLLDMTLHTEALAEATDVVTRANEILAEVFLPVGEDTAFACYFGHLSGYDAGYYGYMWAAAFAADMVTVFRKAPNGLMDTEVGRRLRNEIYAPGDSRDPNESMRAFLGRDTSLEPYLKELGIETS